MAVIGVADPNRLLRNDTGQPGMPLSLTKPLGLGVLNNRHKTTGELFPHAVAAMTALNADASAAALAAGVRCATDITGFGLLGHLYKLARASRVTAIIHAAAVPFLEGARQAARAGFVPGGSRRNLDWVTPHVNAPGVDGAPVIGELAAKGPDSIVIKCAERVPAVSRQQSHAGSDPEAADDQAGA